MRNSAPLLAVFAALAVSGALASGPAPARAETPVLVELFTSEGCSSCPPADRLLARLAGEQGVPGVLVVPLSLHVDYWNRLGWKDPFSSAAFSRRQGDYAARLGNGRIYTPQIVVDGRSEVLGSDEGAARRALDSAARERKASVTVVPHLPGSVRIVVAGAGGADVFLAVAEDGLVSAVTRGENAGRTLSHVAVARELRRLGQVDAAGRFDGEAKVAVRPGAIRVFAFVQEGAAGPVLGVSRPVTLAAR